MRVDDELSVRAAELARRDPHSWGQFLEALSRYSDEREKSCVMAPPDSVFIAQGAARQCAKLLELLENSVKTADLIKNGRPTK